MDDDSAGAIAAATVSDSGRAPGPVASDSESSRTIGAAATGFAMSPLDAARVAGGRVRAATSGRPSTCVARKPRAARPTIPAAASVSWRRVNGKRRAGGSSSSSPGEKYAPTKLGASDVVPTSTGCGATG